MSRLFDLYDHLFFFHENPGSVAFKLAKVTTVVEFSHFHNVSGPSGQRSFLNTQFDHRVIMRSTTLCQLNAETSVETGIEGTFGSP